MSEHRKPGRYPVKLRERTVRMVLESERHCSSQWEAICSVASVQQSHLPNAAGKSSGQQAARRNPVRGPARWATENANTTDLRGPPVRPMASALRPIPGPGRCRVPVQLTRQGATTSNVSGPGSPSTVSPRACWNATTAASVPGPTTGSRGPE